MLGPTNMGEVSVIFGELVRMLKDLPPGGFDKAYASKPPTSTASKSMSFMCEKKMFKDVVRLAELGARLAEQAHNPAEITPDPFVETVLAGIKSLEAKVDQLSLDAANAAAARSEPPKSYAAATTGGSPSAPHLSKPKAGAKGKKPPPAPSPPRTPQITLAQTATKKAEFVELTTEPGDLASRAASSILEALRHQSVADNAQPPPPVAIRGITRNAYTRDIHLHLKDHESLMAIMALKSDDWVSVVNPNLGLKRKVYPVIVHGIPTTFKPTLRKHIRDFIEENHGVLDTATRMVWANKHSIEAGKPFSSLIIHLTDPKAANLAITNRICFKHMLKLTEKSTKRIKQCYTCLDFGHFAKACSESNREFSHCAGPHHYLSCTKLHVPVQCVNCTHHLLDTEFPNNDDANVNDMSEAQKSLCAHSAFSIQCPLRMLQVAKNTHMSDLYNTTSHV